MLTGIASKEYKTHGRRIIKAKRIGSRTVQQNCISWSNLILGKLARIHTKVNTIIHVLIPNVKPLISPAIIGLSIRLSITLTKFKVDGSLWVIICIAQEIHT